MGMVRLDAVAAGPHVLTVTRRNTGADGVGIIGVGVAPEAITSATPVVMVGTMPKTLTDGAACSKCDTYSANIEANVQLLVKDGLNVVRAIALRTPL